MSTATLVDLAARNAADDAAQAAFYRATVESWTLYSVGVAVTILRTVARVRAVGLRELKAEDYLVWVGILFYSVQTGLAYSIGAAAKGLANNGMTDDQRAALSVTNPEYGFRVLGSKIQVAGWTTYSVLMCALKLSILSFYIRLTDKLSSRYRMPIYIGFGLVIGTFLASILTVFIACRPFHKYWQINPDPGNACQAAISRPIVWASFASNVSTDIYLILIPIPMLWTSRLKLVKKIAATVVFGFGIFVLVCAILKSVFVLVDPVHGAELAGAWGTREAFVAVITTNLPMIFHLLKGMVSRFLGTTLGSTDEGYKYRSPSGGGGSSSRGRRGPPHSVHNITTGFTFSESEERIVGAGDGVKLKDWDSGYGAGQGPGAGAGNQPYTGGIVVSNQIEVTSEARRKSQGGQSRSRVRPW
ncbi:uncharacterized protein BJX67DRAFT_383200 [Aspergillus lucknowensis]|uniref:Rhodopsin domain-containing protein n=1 Tax=Aspergillus lucknowensis TaxID=176173 RepID=A0ABR4LKB3_9EURO